MKRFLFYLSIAFTITFSSCKKENKSKMVWVTSSNINSSTTFTIVVKNETQNTTPFDIGTLQGVGNSKWQFRANSNDKLNIHYALYTKNEKNSIGNIDFTVDDANLLHVNGGSGKNFIVKVP